MYNFKDKNNNPYTFVNYLNYLYSSNTNNRVKQNFLNKSDLKDHGPAPFVINIEEITKLNSNYRIALWTGEYLQITLMCINVDEEIGLEVHSNLDQFVRIEQGEGIVKIGDSKDNLNFKRNVCENDVFVIPAGKWHNLTNVGNIPIKLYSIYAPPQHKKGTVHIFKEDEKN